MTTLFDDLEPAPPADAAHVNEWAEHDGLCRHFSTKEKLGVYVFGYQNFDGVERPRMVYLRGERELSADDARAVAQALMDAAHRVTG